ncbi:MAG TPA: hypothetical protein VE986_08600 [Hyphomicrobiales bacterium]|nr:hypothetical protein [Hyphomicrobiales bacterium]
MTAKRTHCYRGHAYTAEMRRGYQYCPQCRLESNRHRREANREAGKRYLEKNPRGHTGDLAAHWDKVISDFAIATSAEAAAEAFGVELETVRFLLASSCKLRDGNRFLSWYDAA